MSQYYKVHITRHAFSQLKEIRQYIENKLKAPESALHLLRALKDAIGNLQTMPSRHQLIDEEPWRKQGIRKIIVKNFYVYYWIDETNLTVHVSCLLDLS